MSSINFFILSIFPFYFHFYFTSKPLDWYLNRPELAYEFLFYPPHQQGCDVQNVAQIANSNPKSPLSEIDWQQLSWLITIWVLWPVSDRFSGTWDCLLPRSTTLMTIARRSLKADTRNNLLIFSCFPSFIFIIHLDKETGSHYSEGQLGNYSSGIFLHCLLKKKKKLNHVISSTWKEILYNVILDVQWHVKFSASLTKRLDTRNN